MRSKKLDLIEKYATPVPRYTSYPTAPHFSCDAEVLQYEALLAGLKPGAALSLYLHIPFCDTLCWFCGCNTKITRRYAPVTEYLNFLWREAENVASICPMNHRVTHVHWGGGSPDILKEEDILRGDERLRSSFNIAADAEIAIEVDPRGLRKAQVDAFARSGVTRISIGVQDFSKRVQHAINRIQSFEETKRAITLFREKGVHSINIDLIYGLPHQTRKSTERSVMKVLELAPNRIALFGYAHLPSRIKHQAMIDDEALPDIFERFEQAQTFASRLLDAGYVRVGLDHFAKPGDALVTARAEGALRRNFQGYTSDRADALIGLGASSIGQFENAYVQNAVPTAHYMRAIEENGFAANKFYELSLDDIIRRDVIEQIMCYLEFSETRLMNLYGEDAAEIIAEGRALLAGHADGLLEKTDTGFIIKEEGRPFLRSISAHFDAHLHASTARHATGV